MNNDPGKAPMNNKQSEIDSELNNLNTCIGRLNDNLRDLYDRLMPILENVPVSATAEPAMRSTSSPMGKSIADISMTVDNMITNVTDIKMRLAI